MTYVAAKWVHIHQWTNGTCRCSLRILLEPPRKRRTRQQQRRSQWLPEETTATNLTQTHTHTPLYKTLSGIMPSQWRYCACVIGNHVWYEWNWLVCQKISSHGSIGSNWDVLEEIKLYCQQIEIIKRTARNRINFGLSLKVRLIVQDFFVGEKLSVVIWKARRLKSRMLITLASSASRNN